VTTLHRRLDLLATEQARPVARGLATVGYGQLEDECAVSLRSLERQLFS